MYIAIYLATRIWRRIGSLRAWQNDRSDHKVRPARSDGSRKVVHIEEDSMAEAWIRQHDRLKQAIAQAMPKDAPTQDDELDDEWVDPWIRQQQRLKDAIAQAKRRNSAAKR